MPKLTIGMATYNDFNGVYFTVQALRMYQDMRDVEIVVVDNMGCDMTRDFMVGWVGNSKYIRAIDAVGTSAPRNRVFLEASSNAVVCLDCHVFLEPGAVAKLKAFYDNNPECNDLIQGPMYNDDLTSMNTHLDPVWRDKMWGIWGHDKRGYDINGQPFDIPMQGLGLFCCRRNSWLGFNTKFQGFGGEEGYIHEKYRQAGYRCLCLPWLRWAHRFGRPDGIPYPLRIFDRIRNYFIGHAELNLDIKPIFDNFIEHVSKEKLIAIATSAIGAQDYTQYFKA